VKKIAILIDGGHLRVAARNSNKQYTPGFIEQFAHRCSAHDEEILRILYYDCAPYTGAAKLPVSGTTSRFNSSGAWLDDLARRDLFAVRLGVLKFRGYKPVRVPVATATLSDNDFKPDFEQKGVDMRIGLDIATFSQIKTIDRIVLISNDTDCIPAMKHGRKAGLQIVVVELLGCRTAPEMLAHADFRRCVTWP
jgi:uncharacterized LabA/DUF88 family protein